MKLTAKFEMRFVSGRGLEAELELELGAQARIAAVFGPSGSGKTTLLRSLAGLERPKQGRIAFGEDIWFDSQSGADLRPWRRRVGLIAQQSCLFPHLSAAANIAYASERAPTPEGSPAETLSVPLLIELLGVGELLARFPAQLSAGERQRVALARSLAARPSLLLLDEPFSGLDQPVRERLREDVSRLIEELRLPALWVTHDRAEALSLGGQLVLIDAGRVRRTGPVHEVFARPADVASARATGFENIVEAARFGVAAPSSRRGFACVRGEDVALVTAVTEAESEVLALHGRVSKIAREGAIARVIVDCGFELTALLGKREFEALRLKRGQAVRAEIAAGEICWLDS